MITKKKLQKIAKIMFKNSYSGKFLDTAKVKKNLDVISKENPQGAVKILKNYKNLINLSLAKEQVIVESQDKLNANTEKELLKKTGAKEIVYELKPEMVFGAKITHGDWVFENGLDSKIKELASIQ